MGKMPYLYVVYGGQWGSEGKGQVTAAIARDEQRPLWAVRVGGPNAGHTAHTVKGTVIKAQQVPIPAFTGVGAGKDIKPPARVIIGATGCILPAVLLDELKLLVELWGPDAPPLFIDENAAVITEEHMKREGRLKKDISSTGEGVGAATADKVMRKPEAVLRNNDEVISSIYEAYPRAIIADTVRMFRRHVVEDAAIVLEGTQGYLLGLHTSGYYPYTTSRECGPEAICAQVGISPRSFYHTEIIGIFRTYPIRVGGPSGPLPGEVTWDYLREKTGGYVDEPERTTVTNKVRRIAKLDSGLVDRVLNETSPDVVAISFLDYLFPSSAKMLGFEELPADAENWLQGFEEHHNVTVKYVSTGPGQQYTFRRRA